MNIITAIYTGVVKDWTAAEAAIEALVAKVKSALPASATPQLAQAISDVKQLASDALTIADSGLSAVAPMLVGAVEKAADEALVTLTNGMALPLVPMTNKGIEDAAAVIVAAAKGWELKAKAGLASNPASGTFTNSPPPPAPPTH